MIAISMGERSSMVHGLSRRSHTFDARTPQLETPPGIMVVNVCGAILQMDRNIQILLQQYGYHSADALLGMELAACVKKFSPIATTNAPDAGGALEWDCIAIFSRIAPQDNHWTVRPLYAGDGSLSAFCFLHCPLTEKADHGLDLSQLRTLVDSIEEPLLVTDGKKRVLLLNDAAQRLLRSHCEVTSAGVLLPFLERSGFSAQLPDYLDTVLNTGKSICFTREIATVNHRC